MNNIVKYVSAFVGGAVVGVVGSSFFFNEKWKQHYAQECEAEVNEFISGHPRTPSHDEPEVVKMDIDPSVDTYSVNPVRESLERLAEQEYPEDDTVDDNYIFAREYRKHRDPFLISEAAFGEDENLESETLHLYDDGTITGFDYEPLDDEDIQKYLGDTLVKYDFIGSEEEKLYVRNYRPDVCSDFIVVKENGPFE